LIFWHPFLCGQLFLADRRIQMEFVSAWTSLY
jgi:hypothetical protein